MSVGAEGRRPLGAIAATGTITATQASASSTYLTAWQDGRPRPGTSDLNAGRGRDQANMAIVGLGGGVIRMYTDMGTTHVLVDVTDYFH